MPKLLQENIIKFYECYTENFEGTMKKLTISLKIFSYFFNNHFKIFLSSYRNFFKISSTFYDTLKRTRTLLTTSPTSSESLQNFSFSEILENFFRSSHDHFTIIFSKCPQISLKNFIKISSTTFSIIFQNFILVLPQYLLISTNVSKNIPYFPRFFCFEKKT